MNMLRFNGLKFLLILSVLCYLSRPVLSDCLNSFVEGFDYFPDKVIFEDDGQNNPEFTLEYHDSYIFVSNIKANEQYVLYCTATEPKFVASTMKFIQIPVKNVAVFDRTTISFLEILGEELSIKYVADEATITSPCLLKHNDTYETMNYANTTQANDVSVIFTDKPLTKQSGESFVTVTIPIDEDATALRKAQWIKFISLFFNKEAVANDAYSKIRNNYLCHSDNVENIPKETRKTIAWVSLESINNFTIKYQSFYPNITLSSAAFPLESMEPTELSADDIRQVINEAYIVIDMSALIAPDDNFDAWKRYFGYDQVADQDLPRFLKKKRLYRTHKLLNTMNSDDWLETSPSRPDILLRDLIAIQYPLYQPDYIVTWFNKFAETGDNVYVSKNQCNDNTFGQPKTDFGTCTPMKFIGDGKDNGGNQIFGVGKHGGDNGNNNNDNENKANVLQPGVIVAVALTGALVVFGLGALLLVALRRRYRRRFVKLRDDPVNSVKEPVVQMDSVKEVK